MLALIKAIRRTCRFLGTVELFVLERLLYRFGRLGEGVPCQAGLRERGRQLQGDRVGFDRPGAEFPARSLFMSFRGRDRGRNGAVRGHDLFVFVSAAWKWAGVVTSANDDGRPPSEG